VNQETKQQVFDVLNEGGIFMSAGGFVPYKEPRLVSMSHNYTDIRDDIETRMLDWLEEPRKGYSTDSHMQMITTYITEYDGSVGEGKTPIKDFKWKDKPRPVAIAEACVWVYQQMQEGK
jgi:hypothetical protein